MRSRARETNIVTFYQKVHVRAEKYYICMTMAGTKTIPTVYDIAREAGVSRGTVDRVLHRRGRFSPDTEARVLDAVKRLGYSANLNAAKLSTRKTRNIACLLPSFSEGEYWAYINRGIMEAVDELGFNLAPAMYLYDQTDIDSFRDCAARLLEDAPDGVVLNVVFREEVIRLSKILDERRIPYAFIDNKVDGLGNMLYVGIDPYRSGQLGAFLLTLQDRPSEIGLVRILRDKGRKGDPNEPRRQGFLDYIGTHFPDTAVHTVFIDPSAPESIEPALEGFMQEHPDVRHLATTNSRIHLVASFLKRHPGIHAVGFDHLDRNLQALKDGCVDFLVTHRIKDMAKECMGLFAESLSTGVPPSEKNHFVHLDILHRLNLE